MTATNMCSNFGGFRCCPPLKKKKMKCFIGKPVNMLDSMKKRRMKESNLDLHAGSLVTSCLGKDAEFYSTKKNSIHQHAGIGCDTSFIVGTIFNLAKVNTANCNL